MAVSLQRAEGAIMTTDERKAVKKQWWFKPTLAGLVYRSGEYPGAGWLPCSKPPASLKARAALLETKT